MVIIKEKSSTYALNLHLSKKEKAFCQIYTQWGVTGVEAVYKAGYNPKNRNTAYSISSENLRKPKILEYIKKLYSEHQLTDADILREHRFLLQQQGNFAAKAKAIDMFYKKSGHYNNNHKDKNPVTVVITSYK